MSVPDINDPWNEIKAQAKKMGYGPQELQILMMGARPKNNSGQATAQIVPSPSSPFKQKLQDMIDSMVDLQMMRSMGFLPPMNQNQTNTQTDLNQMVQQMQQNPNKFTKDDMMMIMMMRMLQGNTDKSGFQTGDMIQLMGIMNQKGSTMQDAFTFLQQLETKKQEGIQEGKETMAQIQQQSSRQETFSDFVDEQAKLGLKNAVSAKIQELFAQPSQTGIIKNGQFDAGEIAKQLINVANKYVQKMPAATAPPPQTTTAEPIETQTEDSGIGIVPADNIPTDNIPPEQTEPQ